MAHQLANAKVTRNETTWELEVTAEIPTELLLQYRKETLQELQRDAKLDGFRPGKAPLERIIAVYGEAAIAERACERAIHQELPELLAAEDALIIESPRVSIERGEQGGPVRFTARVALAPHVELPDYKAIAKTAMTNQEEVSVSDEEHAEALTHLRRERARIGKIEAGSEPQKAHEEARAMKEEELPALDDEFVRSLGIENAEKFSETVRENIRSEKELQAREKRRAALLDELAKRATVHYPTMLRTYELDDMEGRMKHDLQQMGVTFEAYLAQVKKSREQLRAEWQSAADKRAKVRLVLTEIARKEGIEPDQNRLEKEMVRAKKHAPQTDPEALRAHIAHALRNEATLKFLESLT